METIPTDSTQNQWVDYIKTFPIGQQVVIQSLRKTYQNEFGITDFRQFEKRLKTETQILFSELSRLPSGTEFIISLSQWLKEKALGVRDWNEYPVRFDDFEEPFATIISEYYSNLRKISVEQFQDLPDNVIAYDIVFSLPSFNKEFWQYYIEILATQYAEFLEGLQIIEQPKSVNGCPGEIKTFTVVTNLSKVSYQWRRDGRDIRGETNDTFKIKLLAGDNLAKISVLVIGEDTSVLSTSAIIRVEVPQIIDQPADASVQSGNSVSFSISVNGENINYQWRKDNIPLKGETSPILKLEEAQFSDSGFYDCVVSNDCQSIISQKASLVVLDNYMVKGKVIMADQSPAINYLVQAYHYENGVKYLLGESHTNNDGNYMVPFTAEQFGLKWKGKANLFVVVTSQGINQKSPLILGAKKVQEINVITSQLDIKAISEYFKLKEWFDTNVPNFDWNNVTQDDVETFTKSSRLFESWVKSYSQARFISQSLEDVEGYYGMIRTKSGFKTIDFINLKKEEVESALNLAKERNYISSTFDETNITNQLSLNYDNEVESLIESNTDNDIKKFVDLVDFGGASVAIKKKFFELYRENRDTPKKFWLEVDTNLSDFSQSLKLVSQMGAVTSSNFDLMNEIKRTHSFNTAQDLVKLTEIDLETSIQNAGNPIPAYIQGETLSERRKNYAQWISGQIEEAYPTSYMAERISEEPDFPSKTDFSTFFGNNSNFNLGKEPIHEYLSKNENALAGITDPEEFTLNLLKLQRFHTIAPKDKKAIVSKSLFNKNYQSAPDIAITTYETFVNELSADIGEITASQVYASAREVTARSINLAGKYNQSLNSTEFSVVSGNKLDSYSNRLKDIFPDIETLLGETDYCACEHCKSIFGPAAYLVDLLKYSQNIKSENLSLYHVLNQVYSDLNQPRRGDMPKIDLTCKNTNVPLPAIDIVNELLCKLTHDSFPDSRQTTWTEEELRIAPKYPPTNQINEILATNEFPWKLPFDYFTQLIDLQLPIANVSREEISWNLPKVDGDTTSDGELQEIRAISSLSVSKSTWLMLIMKEFNIHSVYNVSGSINDYFEDSSGNLLVKKFIDHIGISFVRFQDLLKITTLNPYEPNGNRKYTISYEDDECSLEKARVSGVENFYKRLYYIEKLSTSLKWDLRNADLFVRGYNLVTAVDNSNSIELEKSLKDIALIKKLASKLGMDLYHTLSWFTSLNTTTYKEDELSQFETIYLNPEVAYTYSDIEKNGLLLNNQRTDLLSPSTLNEMKNVILSSLQISGKSLDLIVSSGWLGESSYVMEVNFVRLQQLYAVTNLATNLNVDISSLIMLWKAYTSNTNSPIQNTYQDIENLIDFVDFVLQLKASSFTIDEVDKLFNYSDLERVLPIGDVTDFLNKLRSTLKEQWQQKINNVDKTQKGIHFLLSTQTLSNVSDVDINNIDIIIRGEYNETDQEVLIDWWNSEFELINFINIDTDDFREKVINISDPSYLTDPKNRIEYIYTVFFEAQQVAPETVTLTETVFTKYTGQFAVEEFVSQFLEDYPQVSPLQNTLLTDSNYLHSLTDTSIPIINVFTNKTEFVENELPIKFDNFPEVYNSYYLIFKNLSFLSKFQHIDKYYSLFYNYRPENWPNPVKFPVTDVSGISTKGLQKVFELYEAEKNHALDKSELFIMMLGVHQGSLENQDNVRLQLSKLTEWSLAEINHLTNSSGFNFEGEYYLESDWIYKLNKAFYTASKLEIEPSVVQELNKLIFLRSDASAVQQTIRKSLVGSTGTEKLIEANDSLRESLRDALVGYVIFKTDVLDNELFEKSKAGLSDFLLTDIEKSACGKTTRVRQALSAIQMLMQRALMGLERLDGVSSTFEVPNGPAEEWIWRKNYRVWEANRKVFMYPENWLLNETRDDQTYLYRNFVEELSQSNVTDESARRAVTNYLKELNEIAKLQIAQIYQEGESVGNARRRNLTNTTHIFARTQNDHHSYYHRKWIDDAYFTPWQELPIDIEGEHLIPTKYSGRLWLFWPIFVEKAIEDEEVSSELSNVPTPQDGRFSATPAQPNKYYEISIAWTTEFRGQWQPKKMSKVKFTTKGISFGEKSSYYFYTDVGDNNDLILTPVFYRPGLRNVDSDVENYTPNTFNQSMRFSGSNSQPELLNESVISSNALLAGAKPFYMHNRFGSNDPIPRLSSGAFPTDPAVNRLITSTTKSLATLPQEFPHNSTRSDYAFFYEDQDRIFFANPEADTSQNIDDVSVSTLEALGATIVRAMTKKTLETTGRSNLLNITGPGNLTPENQQVPVLSDIDGTPYYGSNNSNNVIIGGGDEDDTDFTITKPIIFVPIEPEDPEDSSTPLLPSHRFYTHYHPYANDFYQEVNRYGLRGIYQPIQQNLKRQLAQSGFDFDEVYQPSTGVIPKFPIEDIDFSSFGAYSVYNWELFLHVPLTVAQNLTANYRFAEAQDWLHHIFDPTDSEGETPQRFWKIKPLYNFSAVDTEEELIDLMNGKDENLQKLIKLWEKDPFNPHLIARFRVSTYMRRIIMVYIENLLAWADQLFTTDTMESINEAFQIYMLAWRILGERPEKLPSQEKNPKNIDELLGQDPTSNLNALAQLSDVVSTNIINTAVSFTPSVWQSPAIQLNTLPVYNESISSGLSDNITTSNAMVSQQILPLQDEDSSTYNPAADQFTQAAESMNTMGYFCVLPNTQMYDYWDTVEDRLFKIRNCLNIAGEERSLALFEPPIDPGAIIAALASGQSLGAAISGITAPLPYYRFRYLLNNCFALVQEVKGLGQSMLSALEKADSGELTLLREQHQQNVLEAVRKVKIHAVEEAEQSLLALQAQQENVKYREQFYRNRKYTIAEEENYISGMQTANVLTSSATGLTAVSGILRNFPSISAGINGAFGSPHFSAEVNGEQLAATTSAASSILQFSAGIASSKAGIENTKGSWKRRQDDWTFQAESAKKEVLQIDELISAAEIRIEMAKRDLDAHDRQIKNAVETQQVIDTQFTHRDLYMWMRSELSSLYRKSYNEALSLAKQAEQCFHFELWGDQGPTTDNYILDDHWDGLKKGLLSGEKLERQLRSMQKSYDDQNERLFELRKNVSLSEIDSGALLRLKRTGKTTFSIPEFLFDLDFAGQYQRRIKSVAITIPCVTGPYGNITARLSLTGNLVRKDATLINNEYEKQDNDTRFRNGISPSQSLATTIGTSSANRDSGLFELNFNDERYLPFEGAGVISDWVLELPTAYKQFNYDSISDVILHIDYTARENTGTFKTAVNSFLSDNLNSALEIDAGWNELISIKSQFSDAFYKFLNPAEEQNMEADFVITNKQFPYIFNGLETKITNMMMIIQPKEEFVDEFNTNQVKVILGDADNLPTQETMLYGNSDKEKTYQLLYADFNYSPSIQGTEKKITMKKMADRSTPVVAPEKVEDILLLVSFEKS